jgi:hypothetical protein
MYDQRKFHYTICTLDYRQIVLTIVTGIEPTGFVFIMWRDTTLHFTFSEFT